MQPTYKTQYSAGADIAASETVIIKPNEIKLVPTGFHFHEKIHMLLFVRSSLPLKKGLVLANGVGLIDADYEDEVKVMLHNVTGETVEVKAGDRIAQLMPLSPEVIKQVKSTFPVEDSMRTGGFGSTGE